MKISIELIEDETPFKFKGFTVSQGDKYADGLGYDEMLGLVSALTMPAERPTIVWMRTAEQHKAWRDNLENKSQL